MDDNLNEQREVPVEVADSWWYRVYAAAIITTIIVIAALWAFSRHFG